MRVAIVGTGYVGLVTGACLAHVGHDVTCVDVVPERVSMIDGGESPFFEPGLAELLAEGRDSGRLRATTHLAEAVGSSELTMLAVGTPSAPDGRIDLEAVTAAVAAVGRCLGTGTGRHTVVVKSTVVPGTTQSIVRSTLERESGLPAGRFGLAMNPEFLREGSAVSDFMNADRIVIGELDRLSGETVAELYAGFSCPIVRVSLTNAELIKYASNALLASLVSFANEFANICESIDGADIDVVMDGLSLDRRLSPFVDGHRIRPGILSYLRAGSGFGGSCFPKDVNAIRAEAKAIGVETPLLDAVMGVNRARPGRVVELVSHELGGLSGKTIAVLGVAFKPGTDDIRESPALALASEIRGRGASVRIHDPLPATACAAKAALALIGAVVCETAEELLAGVDAAVLATAWPDYSAWDWAHLTGLMKSAVIVDGRNALRNTRWPEGVAYRPIGNGPSHAVVGVRR